MSQDIKYRIHGEADQKSVDELIKKFGEMGERVTKAGDFLDGLAKKIAAAFTIERVFEFVHHAIEGDAAIQKLSLDTGIAVEALSQLKKMGAEDGVSFDDIVVGLNVFNRKLGDTVHNGGELRTAWRDLNLEIQDGAGVQRKQQDVFSDFLIAFSKITDATEKARVSQEFFARGGRGWISMLSNGAEVAKKFGDAASASVSSETAAQAKEFEDTLEHLKAAFNGLWSAIAKDLLPNLVALSQELLKVTKEGSNTAILAEYLSNGFRGLVTAGMVFWGVLQLIGKEIGYKLAFAFETMIGSARLGAKLFGILGDSVFALEHLFDNLTKKMSVAGQVLDLLKRGEFAAAAKLATSTVTDDFAEFRDTLVKNVKEAGSEVGLFFKNSWESFKAMATQAGQETTEIMKSTYEKIQKLWQTGTVAGVALGGGENRKNENGTPKGKNDNTAAQLIKDIIKMRQEATQTRLHLLDYEQNQLVIKAKKEIVIETEKQKALDNIKEIYATKREEILDKQKQDQAAFLEEEAAANLSAVENNPFLNGMEKAERLNGLYAKQIDAVRQLITLKQAEAKDAKQFEDRLAAQRDLITLKQKEVELGWQMTRLQTQGSLGAKVPKTFEFATDNLGRSEEGGFKSGFLEPFKELDTFVSGTLKTSFDAIGNSIGANILKTGAWKEVAVAAEKQIAQGFIQMLLEYTVFHWARMGMEMVFRTFRLGSITAVTAAGTTATAATTAVSSGAAATTASAWVPAAILSSIASMGVAGYVGLAVVLAALAFGLSSAFADGGPVSGPGGGTDDKIWSRLSNGEYVHTAAATNYYGHDVMAAINAMAIPREHLMGMGGGFGAVGSFHSFSPNVTAQAGPTQVILVKSMDEAYEAMQSGKGEQIMLGHVKRNSTDLGMKS